MFRKVLAIYSIFIGISVLGRWTMIIFTGGISEGSIEISFHLVSEFLMALLLIVSGTGLLGGKSYGKKVFFISYGMLIYSVLNAAGYFGQRDNIAMLCMFTTLFTLSSVFLISGLIRKEFFI